MIGEVYFISIGINTYGSLGAVDSRTVLHIRNLSSSPLMGQRGIIDNAAIRSIDTIITGATNTVHLIDGTETKDNVTVGKSLLYTWGSSFPFDVSNTFDSSSSPPTVLPLPYRITSANFLKLNPTLIIAPGTALFSSTDIPVSPSFAIVPIITINPSPKTNINPAIIITQITTGMHHCIVRDKEGNIYSWGTDNSCGQLGRNIDPSIDRFASSGIVPTRIENFGPQTMTGAVIYLSSGYNHNGFITSKNQLYLWGDDSHGQCSGLSADMTIDNTTVHSTSESTASLSVPYPTRVSFLDGLPLHNYSSQSITKNIPLSITHEGATLTNAIVSISDEHHGYMYRVSCGAWHTAVLTLQGDLYTCGEKSHGALGHSLTPHDPEEEKDKEEEEYEPFVLNSSSRSVQLSNELTLPDVQSFVPIDELLQYKYDRGCLTGIVTEFRKVTIPLSPPPPYHPEPTDTDNQSSTETNKRYRTPDNESYLSMQIEEVACTSRATLVRTVTNSVYVWGTACLPGKLGDTKKMNNCNDSYYSLQRFTLVPQRLPIEQYLASALPSSSLSLSIRPYSLAVGREHYVISCR